MGGVVVDVISSLSPPRSSDSFDILLTRDLCVAEPADNWAIYNKMLVCVGSPNHVMGKTLSTALNADSEYHIEARHTAHLAQSHELDREGHQVGGAIRS